MLASIRSRVVMLAKGGWPALGSLVDSILPMPLDPMALLPIATCRAAGGAISESINVAVAVVLVDISLRIIDDCADMDDPEALYRSIGVGRSINYAMALSTIATCELSRSHLPANRLEELLNCYFRSFLHVCQGQDDDISKPMKTLAEYEEVVKLKTVAAYEFATRVGAHIATSDPNVIAFCSNCGIHLGWMTQILDDIEALWFPSVENSSGIEKPTFPLLFGLIIDHPNTQLLEKLRYAKNYDRTQICTLLDEMNVRSRLLNLALGHRDQAIEALTGSLNPEGGIILRLWLDWLLRDCSRLLEAVS